jgi:CRP-like cAMP-binding protein
MTGMPSRAELKKNLRLLQARLEERPMDLDARMRMARTFRLLEAPKEAVAHYGAVARYLSLGGHPLQAIAVLKELLQVDPTHEESLLFLAKLYARTRAADASNRGRVAVPILDGQGGGQAGDAPPLSVTGLWRAIRPATTDDLAVVHSADDVGAVVDDEATAVDDADIAAVDEDLAGVEAVLAKAPLFAGLDAAAFVALSHAMVLQRVEAGDVVFAAGESGDSCVVIARGEAVVKRGRMVDGRVADVEVDRLGPGDVAGLFALVRTEARQASLVATTALEYFEIDRAAVERLLRTHPSARAALALVLRNRLVATLCAEVPLFARLPEADRQRILDDFAVTLARDAEPLLPADHVDDGFWIVLDGAVVVGDDRADGRVDPSAHLLPGDWLACAAGTARGAAGMSAQAVGPTAVAALTPATMRTLLLRGGADARDALGVTQECTPTLWMGSLRR